MITYEAPAKLNLALHVKAPRPDGYHPLESLVQTVGWLDTVSLSEGEGSDSLEVEGFDVPIEDNLILYALAAVRRLTSLPPLAARLVKEIPSSAGLGGGSSDAAATLAAVAAPAGIEDVTGLASGLGADVSLFLTGGTLMMRGIGDEIEPLPPLDGIAFAVVVPDFGMPTAEVYRRWDAMEGPIGQAVPEGRLPPQLRGGIPMRNDLTPAAIDLEPRMGDYMSDLRNAWDVPVLMTGSGSGCFGLFPSLDEAADAADSTSVSASAARGVALRDRGVARVDLPD